MTDEDFVPEEAVDYDEVFRRGGRNCGDEDYAFFKCSVCGKVYLLDHGGLETPVLESPGKLGVRADS